MATKTEKITIRAEIPAPLFRELEELAGEGGSRNLDEIVIEALRRYAESHRESLAEEFVREDIEWGLRGTD